MQTRFPCVTRQIKSLSGYRGNMRDSEDIFFIIFHFQRVDEWKKIFNTNIAKIFHPGPLFTGALVWFWNIFFIIFHFQRVDEWKKIFNTNIAKIFHPGPLFIGALVWFWRHILYHISFSTGGWMKKYIQHKYS